MDIGKIKRNELDIIITDLLPVEISKIFTIIPFYQYLLTKEKELKKIKRDLLEIKYSQKQLFKKGWHATPLRYNVYKKNGELRQISILNPFSMIQIYFFISLYNSELLNQLLKNNIFSLRYHKANNELYFKYSKKGKISYSDEKADKNYFKTLQSSGMFYDIRPYKLLSKFYSDDKWHIFNSKYKYFAKIDYKDCFGSIYTHTYKWIISNNTIDSRKLNNNHLFSVIDRILQRINSSISNGIVVGPEFSRMIAEILLQQIDYEVYNSLKLIGKQNTISYSISRYVDDIFIFAFDESTIDTIISLYREKSMKYQLKLNDLKSQKGNLPHIWNVWKDETKQFINSYNIRFLYTSQEEEDYLIKAKNFGNEKQRSSIKELFQNLLSKYTEHVDKIVPYIYSALFNGIVNHKKKRLFSKNVVKNEVKYMLDVLFYIYSYSPTYRNTQKLISIIYLISIEVGMSFIKKILRLLFSEYSFIFIKANLEDILDLIVMMSIYEVEIPAYIESILFEKSFKSDNPILAANFLIYSQYNKNLSMELTQQYEEIVNEKMSVILNESEVLLYDELWWGIIFWECPYFSSETKDLIRKKIDFLDSNDQYPSGKIKKLVYDFLHNFESKNKFIRWDINKENIIEDIAYATYERTLFKGNISDFGFEY